MSRFKVLRANPRRTLAAMATLLVAVGVTAASGANFTAQKVNAANTFTSGSLSMTDSVAGAILTASNMKPGDSATGQVRIKSTGTLGGTFSLSKDTLTDSGSTLPLSSQLTLNIVDCGVDFTCGNGDDVATPVYNGNLAAMPSTSLGTWGANAQPNSEHQYKFTVTLAGTADNNYQGGTTSVRFLWDAAA
jgi:spore coat-associated protein N